MFFFVPGYIRIVIGETLSEVTEPGCVFPVTFFQWSNKYLFLRSPLGLSFTSFGQSIFALVEAEAVAARR